MQFQLNSMFQLKLFLCSIDTTVSEVDLSIEI